MTLLQPKENGELVHVLQRNRNRLHVHIERFIIKDWVMQL